MTDRRRLLMLALLAGTLGPGSAPTQTPAEQALTKYYTRQTTFVLPVQLDARERAQLRSLQLYVRPGIGQPWMRAETAPPSVKEFTYSAAGDGEYWFSIVAINQAGQAVPNDVEHEPPESIIVVDTKPPESDLRLLLLDDGTFVLQCDIRDANPDPSKTTIAYPVSQDSWKTLEAEPRSLNCFRVPDPKVLVGQVQVKVWDRVGNSSTRMVNVAALLTAALKHTQPEGKSITTQAQFVRNTRVSLAYTMDAATARDAAKVEVWATTDRGKTWQRAGEDLDRRSPVELDLAGEGLYGVMLVVSTNAGFAGTPPSPGDRPDWWVEVDLTPPAVKLTSIRPSNRPDQPHTYVITWTASDKNLGPTPVTLAYAASHIGPWYPIAQGIKNAGTYTWAAPAALVGPVFVRIEVGDLAGNVSQSEMAVGALPVEGARPEIRVVGFVEEPQK